jgi:hypothetical protein
MKPTLTNQTPVHDREVWNVYRTVVNLVLNVKSERYFYILMLVRRRCKVIFSSLWCVTSRSQAMPTFRVLRGVKEPRLWQVAWRARQGESWVGEVIECTSLPSGQRQLGRPLKRLLYEAETGPLRPYSSWMVMINTGPWLELSKYSSHGSQFQPPTLVHLIHSFSRLLWCISYLAITVVILTEKSCSGKLCYWYLCMSECYNLWCIC